MEVGPKIVRETGQVTAKKLLAQTILNNLLATKSRNTVKLDKTSKMEYLILRVL